MRTDSLYQPPSQRLDRTKLAALVDGRLNGPERDAVLARLAASPSDLEVMSDVLAVAAELDDGVTDIRRSAARRESRVPKRVMWLAAAAAVAAIAIVPLAGRVSLGSGVDGYAGLLASRAPLAAGWDSHSWSATRGSSDGIPERVRGVRVGALTTALDVAVARKDSATPRIATQIAALLVAVPGAGNVVATYRSIAASGNGATAGAVRDARQQAREMVSAATFDDGAWLEAARIAAVEHDSAFFGTRTSRGQLATLERDVADDARAQSDVRAISKLAKNKAWDTLAITTSNILASLAAP
jgi:hypothetical protein